MCMLCIEFQKQRMTLLEAHRAFREMREDMDPVHIKEVEVLLESAAEEEASRQGDPDAD